MPDTESKYERPPTENGAGYSDTHIPENGDSEPWVPIDSDFVMADDAPFSEGNPQTDFIDETFDEPDASFTMPKKRPQNAVKYERKVKGLFQFAWRLTVQNPKTVDDSAAILMYGPGLSTAMGDLAADNVWAAKAIDFMTEGSDNAALNAFMIAMPFTLQLLRNHETAVEVAPEREVRIPFIKRTFRVKFRVRLRRGRQYTTEPSALRQYVYSQASVRASLEKQGIKVPGIDY